MQWRENIKNIQLSFDVLLDKTHLYNMTPKIRHSLFFYYARCAAVEWIFLIPNSMLSPVEKSLVSILHSNTTEELVLCIRLKLGEAHLAPISSSCVLSLPCPALVPFISRSILYHNAQADETVASVIHQSRYHLVVISASFPVRSIQLISVLLTILTLWIKKIWIFGFCRNMLFEMLSWNWFEFVFREIHFSSPFLAVWYINTLGS